MKSCDRCGVALTAGLGGRPHRVAVVFENGHMVSVDLCREHYGDVVRETLAGLIGERVSEPAHAR